MKIYYVSTTFVTKKLNTNYCCSTFLMNGPGRIHIEDVL